MSAAVEAMLPSAVVDSTHGAGARPCAGRHARSS